MQISGNHFKFSGVWGLLAGVSVVIALALPADVRAQDEPEVAPDAPAPSASAPAPSASAPAPSQGFSLWMITSQADDASVEGAFRAALEEALAGEKSRHLFGAQAFGEHISRRSVPFPGCIVGVGSCESAYALALDSAQLTSALRLRLIGQAPELEVHYDAMDRRGQVTRTDILRAATPRELAFATVRHIFDASGMVSFDSEPRGADVLMDGQRVGQTPLVWRLPVGRHAYELVLEDRRTARGEVEVTSTSTRVVQHELGPKPGRLVVEEAPEGARLLVNGEDMGAASQAVELEPGHYAVEVRAEGFESWRQSVRISAGADVRESVTLEPGRGLRLPPVASQAIALQSFGARLSFEQSLHLTSLTHARGTLGSREYEFRTFLSPSDQSEVAQRLMAPSGLRLDMVYTGEHFGMNVLSLSWLTDRPLVQGVMESRTTRGDAFLIEVTRLSRLQVRPFQLNYRFFTNNLVPTIEAGTGINFQWVEVQGPLLDAPMELSQTEAFVVLGGGVQYFFSPQFSAQLRYGLQGYFGEDRGLEHLISVGVGGAVQNLFGFDPEPPGKL